MRIAVAALLPVCTLLLALPASALSDGSAGVAVSARDGRPGRIVLYDRPVPVAALLGRADGAVVARGFAHRGHAPPERAGGRLFAAWRARAGNGFPTTTPRPGGPAIPEPTAALVFGAGLLLVSRRRR